MAAALSTPSRPGASVSDALLSKHGEVMDTNALVELLKFSDRRGLRRAVARGAIPFKTFPMPGRHGPFALTRDVAEWLISATDPN
jgi:hypothetical protein